MLVDHQCYHVPVKYVRSSQSGPVIGSRSPTDSKYKPVENNRSISLPVKFRENKNSNNAENYGVIKSTSKK